MSESVWVLTIGHRHGVDVSAHKTENGALESLVEYVTQYWGETGDDIDTIDMPSDGDDAIAIYFDSVSDEFYSIEETALLP